MYCMFVFGLYIVSITAKLQKLFYFRLSLIKCLIFFFKFRLYLVFIINTDFLDNGIITSQVIV